LILDMVVKAADGRSHDKAGRARKDVCIASVEIEQKFFRRRHDTAVLT
jgi:hypothetical protein